MKLESRAAIPASDWRDRQPRGKRYSARQRTDFRISRHSAKRYSHRVSSRDLPSFKSFPVDIRAAHVSWKTRVIRVPSGDSSVECLLIRFIQGGSKLQPPWQIGIG